mmetsp:Transcript_106507/g.189377  ORF Transcript_106507/g.189377 Transcript_106507/m.189377 type:complete len:103 (+) Transcript_106507:400-708(+)
MHSRRCRTLPQTDRSWSQADSSGRSGYREQGLGSKTLSVVGQKMPEYKQAAVASVRMHLDSKLRYFVQFFFPNPVSCAGTPVAAPKASPSRGWLALYGFTNM